MPSKGSRPKSPRTAIYTSTGGSAGSGSAYGGKADISKVGRSGQGASLEIPVEEVRAWAVELEALAGSLTARSEALAIREQAIAEREAACREIEKPLGESRKAGADAEARLEAERESVAKLTEEVNALLKASRVFLGGTHGIAHALAAPSTVTLRGRSRQLASQLSEMWVEFEEAVDAASRK